MERDTIHRDTIHRDDVRRVLIVGDTHGNAAWFSLIAKVAAAHDCPVIIQVGDFGYFPAHRDGPRFLTAVEDACAAQGVELWFIDGNHDDHASLGNLRHRQLPIAISDHVTYMPRGSRRGLGGATFGFLGGAFSVDWRGRVPGRDWWPNETTELGDIERLGPDPLDVLIAHDAPAGVHLSSSWNLPPQDQVRADEVRSLVASAMTATMPQLVIHGHWHHGYSTDLSWVDRRATVQTGDLSWASSRVVGLGCDGDVGHGWVVLDLPTLAVHWPVVQARA